MGVFSWTGRLFIDRPCYLSRLSINTTMSFPISSHVPFQLGNSDSPLSLSESCARGIYFSSPMVRRLATPRSAKKLPRVSPLSRRIDWQRRNSASLFFSKYECSSVHGYVIGQVFGRRTRKRQGLPKWHNDFNQGGGGEAALILIESESTDVVEGRPPARHPRIRLVTATWGFSNTLQGRCRFGFAIYIKLSLGFREVDRPCM